MVVVRRAVALAGGLNLIAAVGVTAQTVIVTNAPPGSTVDLALNAAVIGSASVPADGIARLSVDPSDRRGRTETDTRIIVDTCADRRLVTLIEPGLQPPAPEAGCVRHEIAGVFVMRTVTTFVVNVAGSTPIVRLRQGPAPPQWLVPGAELPESAFTISPPPGLIVFGGGGLGSYREVVSSSCGDVADCTGGNSRLTYTAGVAFWITPFLAAEATYLRPANVSVEGSGDNHRFDSSLDTHVFTVGGTVGVPAGRGRLYGRGGFTFHRATSTTTQTINDVTVTVDDVAQTIPGGTQTFVIETEGWTWLAGGGGEVWVSPRVAVFGEFVWANLKGDDRAGGEGRFDERLRLFLGGLRVRIF
jgi:hypothetical protein